MPDEKKPDMIEMIKQKMAEEERKKIFQNINYGNIKTDLKKEMIKRAVEEVTHNPYLAKKKPAEDAKAPLTLKLREVDERRRKR